MSPSLLDHYNTIYYRQEITRDLISYPPPDLHLLSYFGRGLSKQQAQEVQGYKSAIILDFVYPLKDMPKGLKLAYERANSLAKLSKGYLWDSETRELFTIKEWESKRLNAWENNLPIVKSQIVIHAYKSNKNIRAITLGMSKFGLPDIVADDFLWSLNQPMSDLIILIGQSMIEGVYPKEGVLQVDVSKLKDSSYKSELLEVVNINFTGKLKILFSDGEWEEGDPQNILIHLDFDSFVGDSNSEKQMNVLQRVFKWEKETYLFSHNQKVTDASGRARLKLTQLEVDFTNGLAPGEFILLKAPFDTPDGSREWMWVEVMSWSGNSIKGLLKNEPHNIPNLKGGSEVVIKQDEVFDYIREFPDGTSVGNETGELIRNAQKH